MAHLMDAVPDENLAFEPFNVCIQIPKILEEAGKKRPGDVRQPVLGILENRRHAG